MTGQRFGRLTVVGDSGESRRGEVLWLCRCDCGNVVTLRGSSLRSGNNRSCGCFRRESEKTRCITHGGTNTRLYHIWVNMIQRCSNANRPDFLRYGGGGVQVCEDWKNFESFQEWSLANGYQEWLTIDRKDNNKGYSPENCRWADVITQANNKRTNHYLEYNGKRLTIAQWASTLGVNPKTLSTRLCRGWSIERTLNTPVRKEGK